MRPIRLSTMASFWAWRRARCWASSVTGEPAASRAASAVPVAPWAAATAAIRASSRLSSRATASRAGSRPLRSLSMAPSRVSSGASRAITAASAESFWACSLVSCSTSAACGSGPSVSARRAARPASSAAAAAAWARLQRVEAGGEPLEEPARLGGAAHLLQRLHAGAQLVEAGERGLERRVLVADEPEELGGHRLQPVLARRRHRRASPRAPPAPPRSPPCGPRRGGPRVRGRARGRAADPRPPPRRPGAPSAASAPRSPRP